VEAVEKVVMEVEQEVELKRWTDSVAALQAQLNALEQQKQAIAQKQQEVARQLIMQQGIVAYLKSLDSNKAPEAVP
jgi:hypothetical protein